MRRAWDSRVASEKCLIKTDTRLYKKNYHLTWWTQSIENRSTQHHKQLFNLVKTLLSPIFVIFHTTTAHHNRFTALFPGPPRWAGARRELLDFMVQGEINRVHTLLHSPVHTDHPAGHHSIRTNQCPPPPSPHFSYYVLMYITVSALQLWVKVYKWSTDPVSGADKSIVTSRTSDGHDTAQWNTPSVDAHCVSAAWTAITYHANKHISDGRRRWHRLWHPIHHSTIHTHHHSPLYSTHSPSFTTLQYTFTIIHHSTVHIHHHSPLYSTHSPSFTTLQYTFTIIHHSTVHIHHHSPLYSTHSPSFTTLQYTFTIIHHSTVHTHHHCYSSSTALNSTDGLFMLCVTDLPIIHTDSLLEQEKER